MQQILQFWVHLSKTLKSTFPYKQTLSAKRHVQLVTGLFYCCQAGIANAMRKLQVSLGTQRHRRRHVASNKIKPYQRIGLFKIQNSCRDSPWAHLGTIHILRIHIFRIFCPPPPPYVIMFLVLKIIKNWHFLTPPPPLQVIT